MVIRPVAFEGLRGLAAIAVLDGDVERAARLVGAADAHRYAHAEDAVAVRLETTYFAPARIGVGRGLERRRARGQRAEFRHAIAYALEDAARR